MAATTRFNVHVELDARQYKQGAGDVAAGNRQVEATSKSTDAAVRRLKATIAGALAGLSFRTIIREVVDAQLAIDAVFSRLRQATGGMVNAKREMAFISAESQRLGLNLIQSSAEFGRFAVAARNTGLARAIFTGVAEASTAMGLSAQQNALALNALSQMISKGRVSAEELRQQFGEHIPGAFRLAAEAIGVSEIKLNDMLDSGELMARDLLPKLAAKLHETFGAQAQERANGLAASFNRLSNAWDQFLRDVSAGGVSEAVREISVEVTKWLSQNRSLASAIGGDLSTVLRTLAGLLKFVADHYEAVRAVVVLLIALKITNWLTSSTAAAASYIIQLLAMEKATWANVKAYVALAAESPGKFFAGMISPIGAVVLALTGLYLLLDKLINRWRQASQAAIDYSTKMAQLEGVTVALWRASNTGQTVSAETYAAGQAAAEAMNTRVVELTDSVEALRKANKAARDAWDSQNAGSDRPNAAGRPSVDPKIAEQTAELARLSKELGVLRTALASVKHEAATPLPEDPLAPLSESEMEKREKAARKLAAELARVNGAFATMMGQLDPAGEAQRKWNEGMAVADEMLARFPDRAMEYARAVYLLKKQLDLALTEPDTPNKAGEKDQLNKLSAFDPDTVKKLFTPAFEEAEKNANFFWGKMKRWGKEFADNLGQGMYESWTQVGDMLAGVLSTFSESAAKVVAGLADALRGLQAAANAQNAGQAAAGGAQTGAGVYGTGMFGDAGRGQGRFGGEMSGNYADVGAEVGGAIGAVIGAGIASAWTFGAGAGAGAAIGSVIGSVIGGLVGSAIKSGADEGLASLRQIGNDVSVEITKNEGGLGGVVAGVGQNIVDGLKRVISTLGATLNSVGDLDLKIRDDQIIVFVNGLRRVFKETADAVNFAIGELLRTADISGVSANARAVLDHARNQQGGSVSAEQLTSDLQFATQMDRMDLGGTGRALAELGDWFRVTRDRAMELGLTQETLAGIIGKLNEGYAAARQSLTNELDALAGIYSAAGAQVAAYAQRVQAALQGAREYNQAVATEAQQRRDRLAFLQREIVAQQAASVAAHAAFAAAQAERDGSGRVSPDGAVDPEQEAHLNVLRQAALEADAAVQTLSGELGVLSQQTDQAAIDVEGRITGIITNSRNLFREFTDQFTSGPMEAFQRQIDQFDDYRDAAADLYDSNMELATTDEQRAAAAAVLAGQLADLDAAEAAYRQTMSDQTYISVLESLSSHLDDQRLSAELQRIKGALELAQLHAQIEILRGLGTLTAEQMALVDGAFADLTAYYNAHGNLGGGGGGGKGGGGGRREGRDALNEELRNAQNPLSGYVARLKEINDKIADWTERARKLGVSLDEVKKAGDALKAALRGEIVGDLQAIVSGQTGVGKSIAEIKKQRDDLLKVAAELHIPLRLIGAAFRAQLREIVKGVRMEVRQYANVNGEDSLGIAIAQNHSTAEELRKKLAELAAEGVNTTHDLELVNQAERERNQLLIANAKVGFLQGLSQWVKDEGLAMELRKAEAALQLQSLQAQLQTLLANGNLTDAQRKQYEDWLALATKGIEDFINTGDMPGDNTDNGPTPAEQLADWKKEFASFKFGSGVGDQIQAIKDQADKLRKSVTDLKLPADQTAAALAEVTDAERERLAALGDAAVADLLEGVAQYVTNEEQRQALLDQAKQLRYTWEIAQLRITLELLNAQHLIATETYDLIDGILDNLPATVPGAGDTGGSNNNWQARLEAQQALADRIAKALEALRKYQVQVAHNPLQEAIDALNADFSEIRAVLGNTIEVQQTYAAALADIYNNFLAGIRDAQKSLALGAQSPLDPMAQFGLLSQEWADTVAAFRSGDMSVVQDIPGLAQQLLEMAQQVYPTGSEPYRDLYDQVQAFLSEVLSIGGDGSGIYGQPQAVELSGPITVDGISALAGEVSEGNAAQVSELQRIGDLNDRAVIALELLAERLTAPPPPGNGVT